MRIIAKKAKVNGWLVNDCYSFIKLCNDLVVKHYSNNDRGTYLRTICIKTYDDNEEGRTKANEIYKQLIEKGYEVRYKD